MEKAIITGSCGFIGSCLAERLMDSDVKVIGIDNLSRPGSEINSNNLYGPLFKLHRVDLSQTPKVMELFSDIGPVDVVFHLAAQVAVTKSYESPQLDFFDNALASFNVIEAVRKYTPESYCLYASTNKVYGNIVDKNPIGMNHPLNPYTPYGVSKAVGELYFTEYGRLEMGLTTCSFRQSCIYGPKQFGVEDQGWFSWFVIANIFNLPIVIYGDGLQVRDLLYIEDLIDLYLESYNRRLVGVYPVGGGINNTLNIKEALSLIEKTTNKEFKDIKYSTTRPGDQPYFIADLSWQRGTNLEWSPRISIPQGLQLIINWIMENKDIFQNYFLNKY